MSISKKLGAIFGKVHNYYRYRLIPGVENFRGSVKFPGLSFQNYKLA